MGKYHSKEPGPFHVTKMPTPGERINMKEREDIMRMSLFP